jgi:hypothetical protein
VHVQSVCNDIVRKLMKPQDNKRKEKETITCAGSISYVNNVGDVVIPMDKLEDLGLTNGGDKRYTVLSMERWAQKAVAAGLHSAVAALIETFDEPGSPAYPALLKDRSY